MSLSTLRMRTIVILPYSHLVVELWSNINTVHRTMEVVVFQQCSFKMLFPLQEQSRHRNAWMLSNNSAKQPCTVDFKVHYPNVFFFKESLFYQSLPV